MPAVIPRVLIVLTFCLPLALAGCGRGAILDPTGSASLSPPSGVPNSSAPPGNSAPPSGTQPPTPPNPPSPPSPTQQSSTFIFVRNSQAGTGLQVLRFNSDGSIVPVSGSPFAYHAQSLGVAGGYLIAGPFGEMATYHVDADSGAVTQVSTFVKGGGSSIAGNEHFVYAGTENAIYGYSLLSGQLVALQGFPYGVVVNPCACATPDYMNLTIRQSYLLFSVSSGHAGSGFEIHKIEADGTFSKAAFGGGTSGPSDAINVTPDGRFIYQSASALSSMQVSPFDPNSGTLGDTKPVGPQNLYDLGVIDPGSQFLITRQHVPAAGIGFYRIDPNTGQLSLAASLSESGYPQAIDPSGQYVLTLENPTQSTYALGVYSIDANAGKLSRLGSYRLGSFSNDYAPGSFIIARF